MSGIMFLFWVPDPESIKPFKASAPFRRSRTFSNLKFFEFFIHKCAINITLNIPALFWSSEYLRNPFHKQTSVMSLERHTKNVIDFFHHHFWKDFFLSLIPSVLKYNFLVILLAKGTMSYLSSPWNFRVWEICLGFRRQIASRTNYLATSIGAISLESAGNVCEV